MTTERAVGLLILESIRDEEDIGQRSGQKALVEDGKDIQSFSSSSELEGD
jgi:hypothetical protein